MKRALIALGLGLAGIVLFLAALTAFQTLLHVLRAGDVARYAIVLPFEFAVYAGIVAVLERRRAAELQLRKCLPETGAGFAAGIALFSAAVGLLALGGWYAVRGHSALTAIFAPLIVWTSAAAGEELLFRGFVFRVLQNVGGTWIALGVSSLLFGFAHALNPGATLWSSMAIALQAGVLLGLAFTITRRLWLPLGIHIGWNFAEGTIYGTAVSGFRMRGTFLYGTVHGPVLLTGGKFGVEASIEATVACVLASAALLAVAWRKRRIVPLGVNAHPVVEASAT